MKPKHLDNTFVVTFVILCSVLFSLSCTVKLKDRNAPSLKADLEVDYEVARWGGERRSLAPTPPEVKASGTETSGVGLLIRGQFSNTITWTDPEGTLEVDYTIGGTHVHEETAITADGLSYRGRISLMPGFSFWGDRLFLAGLVGLEGRYLDLEIKSADDSAPDDDGNFGTFGIPLGFHVECTIAHTVTPSITYAYVPIVSEWGSVLSGHDSTVQLALRLWPGSLISGLGSLLWIDGGWLWTSSRGASLLFTEYEMDISGPYLGIGLRF